jgi:hypothetical protein
LSDFLQVTGNAENFEHYQRMAADDDLAQELQREKEKLDLGRPRTPATQAVKPLQPEYGGVAYIDNVNGTPEVGGGG